jgi:hypothetical protein
VYEFESCISEFLHIWIARAHHPIGDDTSLYACLSGIGDPSGEIRRECGLTTREYDPSILSFDKIIYDLNSLLIGDIESVRWIGTKMTCIVAVTIYLDVSDVCHDREKD